MMNVRYGWSAVQVWWALAVCERRSNSYAPTRVPVVGRLMRVLASGLIIFATSPLDVLAQTPAATSAQPAVAQVVQHRVLFGDAQRTQRQRQQVAKHHDAPARVAIHYTHRLGAYGPRRRL